MIVKASDLFGLVSSKSPIETMKVDIETNKNMEYTLSISDKVYGLSIDAQATVLTKDYLVRVILLDTKGDEHLILEAYNELNDNRFIQFVNYCEETKTLQGVIPKTLKIIVIGAFLNLYSINYAIEEDSQYCKINLENDNYRLLQIKDIVGRINDYNVSHFKLWRAGVTSLSKKSYSEKKRILGLNDDESTGGMEYYDGGIFEIGENEFENISRRNTSPFVDSFDWRDRHGKNWISPNKNQGNSGYCHFFTSIACTEALVNLYFNRILNLDLSEQELACCSGIYNPYNYGVHNDSSELQKPFDYIINYGVCDELAYPFIDDSSQTICRSSEIIPNELVKINGYVKIDNTNEDSIKKAIINHGPLVSGIKYWIPNPDNTPHNIGHAMLVVGYGILNVGDTIYHWINPDGQANGAYTAHPNNPGIGMTYWIYKNSYGLSYDEAHEGYMHVIHYDYSKSFTHTYYFKPPLTLMSYNDDDIICSDSDGDGYYYWGAGENRPSYCPAWIPEIADGDDSDITKGSMGEYGYLNNLNPNNMPTYTVTGNELINSRQTMFTHIHIPTNSSLTVNNILNLLGDIEITIDNGGLLLIDGGVITNAKISFSNGGKVEIKNGGKLVMRTGVNFVAPTGVMVDIKNGNILRSCDFQ